MRYERKWVPTLLNTESDLTNWLSFFSHQGCRSPRTVSWFHVRRRKFSQCFSWPRTRSCCGVCDGFSREKGALGCPTGMKNLFILQSYFYFVINFFLSQNIHLVKKWLPTLEKKLEFYAEGSHEDYRVFMSAEPAATPSAHIIPQVRSYHRKSTFLLRVRFHSSCCHVTGNSGIVHQNNQRTSHRNAGKPAQGFR